jgi:hypothetical protein
VYQCTKTLSVAKKPVVLYGIIGWEGLLEEEDPKYNGRVSREKIIPPQMGKGCHIQVQRWRDSSDGDRYMPK